MEGRRDGRKKTKDKSKRIIVKMQLAVGSWQLAIRYNEMLEN
jgi:hypothetical protein